MLDDIDAVDYKSAVLADEDSSKKPFSGSEYLIDDSLNEDASQASAFGDGSDYSNEELKQLGDTEDCIEVDEFDDVFDHLEDNRETYRALLEAEAEEMGDSSKEQSKENIDDKTGDGRRKFEPRFIQKRENSLDLKFNKCKTLPEITITFTDGEKDFEIDEIVEGCEEPIASKFEKFKGIVKYWNKDEKKLIVQYDKRQCLYSKSDIICGKNTQAEWRCTELSQREKCKAYRQNMKNKIISSIACVKNFFENVSETDDNCIEEEKNVVLYSNQNFISNKISKINSILFGMYIEENIYTSCKIKTHIDIYKKYVRFRDSNSSVRECVKKLDSRSLEAIAKEIYEVEEENKNCLYLDQESSDLYREAVRKVIVALNLMSKELSTYPCNVPPDDLVYDFNSFFTPVSKYTEKNGYHFRCGEKGRGLYKINISSGSYGEDSTSFVSLSFVEKTIVVINTFEREFMQKNNKNRKLLHKYFAIRGLSRVQTPECVKIRDNYFENLDEKKDALLKGIIRVFTACFRHYQREDSWKRQYIFQTLSHFFPYIAKYWSFVHRGGHEGGNFHDLFVAFSRSEFSESIKVGGDFLICFDDLELLKVYSYNLGKRKKEYIETFAVQIFSECDIVDKNSSEMRMWMVDEPAGLECAQVFFSEHKCKNINCGSQKVFLVSEMQALDIDGPMITYFRCSVCGKIFTIESS